MSCSNLEKSNKIPAKIISGADIFTPALFSKGPSIYDVHTKREEGSGQRRRPGAEFGRTEKCVAKMSEWGFFWKISIFAAKNSDDPFLVIDQIFQIFLCFSQIFAIFDMLNVAFDPFWILSHASDNTTSLNIGGDQCIGRPPPQILGWPSSPSPP